MKTAFGILLSLFLFANTNVFSQTGILDSSFNLSGIGEFAFPSSEYSSAFSLAIRQDGKIVVGGQHDPPHSHTTFALARFNFDGTLDKSFGDAGSISKDIGVGGDTGGYIALQKDDKIVLGGYCLDPDTHNTVFSLTRFNANGALDNSFNGTGTAFTVFNNSGNIFFGGPVAIQKNQKIIQIGTSYNIISSGNPLNSSKIAMVRYNSNGTIDDSFGINGKTITDFGHQNCGPSAIAIQSDDKIVVCGSSGGGAIADYFTVMARYNVDGSLDSTFGINGKVITYFRNGGINDTTLEYGGATSIAIQPDGKIILGGGAYLETDTVPVLRFLRYNANGSLDSSFGNGGKVSTKMIIRIDVYSACLQPDGKIILAGKWGGNDPTSFALLRYNNNGTVDSGFGENGFSITSIETFDNDVIKSVALQSDGRIVAAGGSSHNGMVVLRFLSGLNLGLLDFCNENYPLLIYPNPIHSEAMLQYKLTKDEKLSIVLYDILGRQVQTFVTNQLRTQGEHKEVLQFSSALSAGNYILSISNGQGSQQVKIVKL